MSQEEDARQDEGNNDMQITYNIIFITMIMMRRQSLYICCLFLFLSISSFDVSFFLCTSLLDVIYCLVYSFLCYCSISFWFTFFLLLMLVCSALASYYPSTSEKKAGEWDGRTTCSVTENTAREVSAGLRQKHIWAWTSRSSELYWLSSEFPEGSWDEKGENRREQERDSLSHPTDGVEEWVVFPCSWVLFTNCRQKDPLYFFSLFSLEETCDCSLPLLLRDWISRNDTKEGRKRELP